LSSDGFSPRSKRVNFSLQMRLQEASPPPFFFFFFCDRGLSSSSPVTPSVRRRVSFRSRLESARGLIHFFPLLARHSRSRCGNSPKGSTLSLQFLNQTSARTFHPPPFLPPCIDFKLPRPSLIGPGPLLARKGCVRGIGVGWDRSSLSHIILFSLFEIPIPVSALPFACHRDRSVPFSLFLPQRWRRMSESYAFFSLFFRTGDPSSDVPASKGQRVRCDRLQA